MRLIKEEPPQRCVLALFQDYRFIASGPELDHLAFTGKLAISAIFLWGSSTSLPIITGLENGMTSSVEYQSKLLNFHTATMHHCNLAPWPSCLA